MGPNLQTVVIEIRRGKLIKFWRTLKEKLKCDHKRRSGGWWWCDSEDASGRCQRCSRRRRWANWQVAMWAKWKKEGEKEMEMWEKGCVRREWWVVPSLMVDDYATTSGRGEKLSVSERNRWKRNRKKKEKKEKKENERNRKWGGRLLVG